MSRTGATAPEAFDKLRSQSQTRSIKLTGVAHEVVAEAVRRARARHTEAATEPRAPGPDIWAHPLPDAGPLTGAH